MITAIRTPSATDAKRTQETTARLSPRVAVALTLTVLFISQLVANAETLVAKSAAVYPISVNGTGTLLDRTLQSPCTISGIECDKNHANRSLVGAVTLDSQQYAGTLVSQSVGRADRRMNDSFSGARNQALITRSIELSRLPSIDDYTTTVTKSFVQSSFSEQRAPFDLLATDNAYFQPETTAVPEPATWMTALVAVAFGAWCRRARLFRLLRWHRV